VKDESIGADSIDFDFSRDNLRKLINSGSDALKILTEIVKNTAAPKGGCVCTIRGLKN
jgi:hypothetical protein